MFYKKNLLLKNSSNLKVKLSNFASGLNTEVDENCLPFKYAKECYNYDFSRGNLQTGLGFEKLTFLKYNDSSVERELIFDEDITEVNKVWLYPYYNNHTKVKDHLLVASCDDKVFYCQIICIDPYIYPITNNVSFTSVPNAIYYNLDGEDVMLLTSATDGMLVYHPQYVNELDSDAPKISSMCRHYERIFAIEEGKRTKLVFSDNLDPTNWNVGLNEAGYIDLADERGGLEKVVSFNDYVYIFKEYGISRLSAYGDQTQFSITNLFVSSGKIYGNSVCVCGNRIMFLSKDGIYAFDGYSTTKLSLNVESLFRDVDNDNCCSAYFNGKYYLGLKLDFNDNELVGCESYSDGFVNNALIEIDLKTGDLNITRGVDLKSICAIEYEKVKKLVCAFNGEHKGKLGQLTHTGTIFGQPLTKKWLSSYTNLGYPKKKKKIKSVSLISKKPCKLILKTDLGESKYDVAGSDKTNLIITHNEGEMFQFGIESDSSEAYIADAEISLVVSR